MMKKRLISALLLGLALPSIEAAEIYLSPEGNDLSRGSIEAPIKTLREAERRVAKIAQEDESSDINLILRGGRYEVDQTIVFSQENLPNKGSLNIKAYNEERPIISAGRKVEGWRKCVDYPEGTPQVAKGNLYVADIPDGVTDFKSMFCGEERLTRARSKNFVMPGNEVVRQADSRNVYYNKDRIHLRILPFEDQIKDWDNLSDVEIFFNPVPWCLNFIPIESVDMERKIAYLAYEANAMPFSAGKHSFAFVENVIDYLDEEGEWCVNTKSRKIYYWSKGEPKSVYVPLLREIIKVEGKIRYDMASDIPVRNVNFKGLTFSHGDRTEWYKNRKGWGIQHDWDTFDYNNAMLRFRGAENCVVDECLFTNSAGSAIRLDLHAQHITIKNSMISNVGHMGILLAGYGPGTKDVNKHNTIENNIIKECGSVVWHGHGIFAWQSGENIIRNNYIHDVPRKAIGVCGVRCQILMKPENNFDEASMTIRWSEIEATIDSTNMKIIERYAPYLHARNNIIENNHIERTMLELSDGSSINVSGAGLGNIVRHNYLYDIPYVGIRTDDWQDGTLIENNILHNIGSRGVVYKGINTLQNNILINCSTAIHFRAYPKQYFDPNNCVIERNIIYSDQKKFSANSTFKWGTMPVSKEGKKTIPYEYEMDHNSYYFNGAKDDLNEKRNNGIEANGVVMDPKFKSLKEHNYTIQNNKLIKAIGFKPFNTNLSNFGITPTFPQWLKSKDNTLR